MSVFVCMFFCLLESGTVVFLILRFEKERKEFYDRLMARSLQDLRRSESPSGLKSRLRSLKEDWRAKKAAKEIEKSENI